jgi:methionine-rich copper-binding protein CopC
MNAKLLMSSAALVLASSFASSAWAHAKLEAAEPKAGSTVAASPKEIRLQFNEVLEAPFSKIKLVDAKDAVVEPAAVAVDKDNPKALIATMPALAAGAYRVQWSTVTRDGHKVKGEYTFNVK